MVLLIIFLLTLFLSRPTFAVDPVVTITNFPQSVIAGDTFPITFTVSSGNTGTYHYKAVSDSSTTIEIFPSCASNYNNCSNIIISDTSPTTATAYAKINTVSTSNNLFIRIAEADTHSKTTDSSYVTIQSIQAIPTPTSTPSPIPPTSTSSPTQTPSPTNIPTSTSTPSPTATPASVLTININSLPSTVSVNQNFNVSFTVDNITPNQEYYFKVFGGMDGDNYGIETKNNGDYYGFTSSWDNFPKFSSTSNSLSQTLTARVKSDKSAGFYQVKLKIRKTDGTFDKESDAKTITVSATTPTSTLTPIPTTTPTPKLTPSPTLTPTLTSALSPTPTEEEMITENPISSDQQVLGDTNINLTPAASEVTASTKINRFFPLLLIVAGGLLLLTPIVITQFKKS